MTAAREFGSLREFGGGVALLKFVMCAGWRPEPVEGLKNKANLHPPFPPTKLLNPPKLPPTLQKRILTPFNPLFKSYVRSLGVLRNIAKRISDSPEKFTTHLLCPPADLPKTLQCSRKLPNSRQ